MNPCVFIIFSLLLLNLETITANQLVALEGEKGGNGVISKCLDQERDALLHFKAGLQDPNEFKCLSTWRADKHDCCKWRGVTCNNHTGYVTKLALRNCHLVGEINSSLLNLSYLNHLHLFFNSFQGTIPAFIGSMTRLRHLDLSLNNLNGIIPSSIGSMTRLRHLDLSLNNLNGIIPSSIGSMTRLRHLDLSLNNLNGIIPSSIGSMTRLRHLDLSNNNLNGTIPSSIGSLTNLNHLDLFQNSFHGTIPTFIGSMTRLRHLDLSLNNLNGIIPSSIGSMTRLRHLDLSLNNLNGIIPSSIGSMTRLRHLDLSNNNLNGTIPSSIGSLTNLNHLDLFLNSFQGTIPTFIGSMTRLRHLDLSNNNLNGTIPSSIGSLTKLRFLDLSYNSLYGTIPPELGNLMNLQQLYLGSNGRCRVENLEWLSHLTDLESLFMDGTSLAKANHWVDAILSLRKLSYLSLEGCELSQVMYPYSSSINSSSSSIESLSLRNNNLTSSMYRWLFPLTSNNLSDLDLSSNMLDGIPKYLGNLCSLTYLYLYNNSAVINLPEFLNNLTGCTSLALQQLGASHSQFTGPLPGNIQTLTNITLLTLISCNLGPRFPNWIQTLKSLTHLDIPDNRIADTIPLDFWDSWPSQLRYMNLSSNNISGEVPDLSSNFDNSSVIDLSFNSFYGPITNVSSTVALLNLSRNKFSGGISFLCQVVHGFLEFLDLSYNLLSGELPDCLWQFKELKVLNLGHNNLSGRLPLSIGSLIQLEVLYLYNNNFSGDLTLSLKNCTSLNSLILGANKFSGNVPVWIGERLSGLYVLILRSNNFFGTIPLQLCQLANLQILDMSMNHLHGTIPSCLDNLTRMVQEGGFLQTQNVHYYLIQWFQSGGGSDDFLNGKYVDNAMIEWQGDEREFSSNLIFVKMIDLSSNNLTGRIPYELTNLHELVALNLSKNALLGEIPQKIGEMQKLLSLGLSRNNLSGRIPSSMSQMTLLNDLDLSFNNLSGRIPTSTQLQSFPPSRYDGNARLCGPPLTKTCPGDEEPEVPSVVGKSEGDGEDIDELWGWFYIGGGTGFATGFWIACGVLLLNRRGRHAFFHFYDRFSDWVYVKVAVFIASLHRVLHT